MSAAIRALTKGIQDQLEGMVKRANLVPGYLDRVIYKEYQNAQRTRWKTENEGDDFEGGMWDTLDPEYETWKIAKYGSNPMGHGEKILIASGRLFFGVVGPGPDHQKIVGERSIRINTSVPYATHVDEKRTFTQWSPRFYSRLGKGLTDYLTKAIEKQVFNG